MKKFLVGAGLLALTALPALAQTGGSEVVVVRVEHNGNRGLITVSSGANSTQVKELDVTFNSVKAAPILAEATQQALAPLLQQGYTLTGMSGGDLVTTMVLTKKK